MAVDKITESLRKRAEDEAVPLDFHPQPLGVKLPPYVYLVASEGEWPVDAIADDSRTTVDRVIVAVDDRLAGDRSPYARARIHVYRIPVTGTVEIEVVPEQMVAAELRPKEA
jgi:hypothetical protein